MSLPFTLVVMTGIKPLGKLLVASLWGGSFFLVYGALAGLLFALAHRGYWDGLLIFAGAGEGAMTGAIGGPMHQIVLWAQAKRLPATPGLLRRIAIGVLVFSLSFLAHQRGPAAFWPAVVCTVIAGTGGAIYGAMGQVIRDALGNTYDR